MPVTLKTVLSGLDLSLEIQTHISTWLFNISLGYESSQIYMTKTELFNFLSKNCPLWSVLHVSYE